MYVCVYWCAPVYIWCFIYMCNMCLLLQQPYPYRIEIWSLEHRSCWWWWWYSKICMCVCINIYSPQANACFKSTNDWNTHTQTNEYDVSRASYHHTSPHKRYHTSGCCRRTGQNLKKIILTVAYGRIYIFTHTYVWVCSRARAYVYYLWLLKA